MTILARLAAIEAAIAGIHSQIDSLSNVPAPGLDDLKSQVASLTDQVQTIIGEIGTEPTADQPAASTEPAPDAGV